MCMQSHTEYSKSIRAIILTNIVMVYIYKITKKTHITLHYQVLIYIQFPTVPMSLVVPGLSVTMYCVLAVT